MSQFEKFFYFGVILNSVIVVEHGHYFLLFISEFMGDRLFGLRVSSALCDASGVYEDDTE
jgi:hypothetical protein